MVRFLFLLASFSLMSKANAETKPFRTFLTIQKYILENSGDKGNGIHNVRLIVTRPDKTKVMVLPEGNQSFAIGNGQTQEINRSYEIPASWIVNNGFRFTLQMDRSGAHLMPCNFDVVQLDQFNRAYLCHTDIAWQLHQGIKEDELDKEGIQIRVFTTLEIPEKEIPQDAILLKADNTIEQQDSLIAKLFSLTARLKLGALTNLLQD